MVTEKVLTDDEKNALLDGMNSGAVQVQSSGGPRYASVRPFELAARARIVTNSFPRLQAVNDRFVTSLSRQAETLLQCETDIKPLGIDVRLFSESETQLSGRAVVVIFEAAPLQGNALIVLRPELVGHLVEAFFGGPGGTGSSNGLPGFSAGELSVSNLFCNLVLASVAETWQPLIELKPQRVRTETSLDHVELGGESDQVIECGFEMTIGEQGDHHGQFQILWPRDTVRTLLPALEGKKRERSAAKDALWEKAIRRGLADVPMKITTCIGHARLPLGGLLGLSPGDVVSIDSPRPATVLAGNVPILNGRFGIFDGRNAVEATEWRSRGNGSNSRKNP